MTTTLLVVLALAVLFMYFSRRVEGMVTGYGYNIAGGLENAQTTAYGGAGLGIMSSAAPLVAEPMAGSGVLVPGAPPPPAPAGTCPARCTVYNEAGAVVYTGPCQPEVHLVPAGPPVPAGCPACPACPTVPGAPSAVVPSAVVPSAVVPIGPGTVPSVPNWTPSTSASPSPQPQPQSSLLTSGNIEVADMAGHIMWRGTGGTHINTADWPQTNMLSGVSQLAPAPAPVGIVPGPMAVPAPGPMADASPAPGPMVEAAPAPSPAPYETPLPTADPRSGLIGYIEPQCFDAGYFAKNNTGVDGTNAQAAYGEYLSRLTQPGAYKRIMVFDKCKNEQVNTFGQALPAPAPAPAVPTPAPAVPAPAPAPSPDITTYDPNNLDVDYIPGQSADMNLVPGLGTVVPSPQVLAVPSPAPAPGKQIPYVSNAAIGQATKANFDYEFYRATGPGLAKFTPDQLWNHWLVNRTRESRPWRVKPAMLAALLPAGAKPVAKPAAKPAAKPVAKPIAKPAAQPVAKPVAKPIAKPAAQPIAPQPGNTVTRNNFDYDYYRANTMPDSPLRKASNDAVWKHFDTVGRKEPGRRWRVKMTAAKTK